MQKAQDVLKAVAGMQQGRDARKAVQVPSPARPESPQAASDCSTSYGSIVPLSPDTPADARIKREVAKKEALRIETSEPSAAGVEGKGAVAGKAQGSPWLADLMGQMGQLKNQMQHLQQLRSPAISVGQDSPAPAAAMDEDSPESSSGVSSITAPSVRTPHSAAPSSSNTPGKIVVSAGRAVGGANGEPLPKHKQAASGSGRERMSFPLPAGGSDKIKKSSGAGRQAAMVGDGLESRSVSEEGDHGAVCVYAVWF
jgi:hypothetical protein